MKKNMRSADRIIRILAAIIFAALYFTGTVTGTWGIVLLVLGSIFVVTRLIATCPVYAIFGMGTCSAKEATTKV